MAKMDEDREDVQNVNAEPKKKRGRPRKKKIAESANLESKPKTTTAKKTPRKRVTKEKSKPKPKARKQGPRPGAEGYRAKFGRDPSPNVIFGQDEISGFLGVSQSTLRRAVGRYPDCPVIRDVGNSWFADKDDLETWRKTNGIGEQRHKGGKTSTEPVEFLDAAFDFDGVGAGDIDELAIAQEAARSSLVMYRLATELLSSFKIDKASLSSPGKLEGNFKIMEKFTKAGKDLQDQLGRLSDIREKRKHYLTLAECKDAMSRTLDLVPIAVKHSLDDFIASLRKYEVEEYGEVQTDSDIMSHIRDSSIKSGRRKMSELLSREARED